MINESLPGGAMVARDQPLRDAYEQAEFQSWLPIEITQISSGHYAGHIYALENNELGVCWERQNRTIHKRSVMDRELCTVSFFRNEQLQNGFAEYKPADNSLFFLPGGSDIDIHVAANVETVYFRFNQLLLLDKARAMDPSRWDGSSTSPLCLDLDLANLKLLNEFVEGIFHQSQPDNHSDADADADADGAVLSDIIMEHILAALNASRLATTEKSKLLITRRRAKYTVNRVIDYIKAQLQQHVCPSVSAICADLQLSERTLQYSFNAILGISPYTYLRYMRLNGVRAALMRPINERLTITRVASHWHFLHMGRFSKDYQQMFDELPSVTLHRALRA